jgi:hypothetical protein
VNLDTIRRKAARRQKILMSFRSGEEGGGYSSDENPSGELEVEKLQN